MPTIKSITTLALATLLTFSLAQDTATSTNPTFALRAWPYGNGTLSGPYNVDTIRLNALLGVSWKQPQYFEIANYYDYSVVYFYLNASSSLIAWGNAPVQIPSNLSNPFNYGKDLIGSTGFRFEPATEDVYEHLVWDPEDGGEFGTFYACWQTGNIYGPSVYYRDADGVTPEECVDVLLLPQW